MRYELADIYNRFRSEEDIRKKIKILKQFRDKQLKYDIKWDNLIAVWEKKLN